MRGIPVAWFLVHTEEAAVNATKKLLGTVQFQFIFY
jgi:hypothetical protein